MLEVKQRSKELVKEFAEASKAKDFVALSNLLDDDGEFQIHNPQNERQDVDKMMFVLWYIAKLNATEITDTKLDQCLDCHLGNPVVLFNKGRFPVKLNEYGARVRSGLMLGIENEKINLIKLCYVFLGTDNNYFEDYMSRKTHCLMAEGVDFFEASRLVKRMDQDQIVFDALSEEDGAKRD